MLSDLQSACLSIPYVDKHVAFHRPSYLPPATPSKFGRRSKGRCPPHKHCVLASPVAKVGNASLCKRRSQSFGTQAPNVHGQPLFLAPLIPQRPRSLSMLRCCKYPTPPHNTCMQAPPPLMITFEADPEHLPHTVAEVEFEA